MRKFYNTLLISPSSQHHLLSDLLHGTPKKRGAVQLLCVYINRNGCLFVASCMPGYPLGIAGLVGIDMCIVFAVF